MRRINEDYQALIHQQPMTDHIAMMPDILHKRVKSIILGLVGEG